MKGNDKYTKHLCAFIDILGYKNLVDEADNSGNPLVIIENIELIIKECIKEYLDLKNEGEDRYTYEIFSDSIIISAAIEDNEDDNKYLEYIYSQLCYLILIIQGIQMQSLKYNIIFRGSISIGNHYRSENVMFSKALVNAYTSESKQAIYPRVIIDTKFSGDRALGSQKLLDSLVLSGYLLEDENCYFVDYVSRIYSFMDIEYEIVKTFLELHKDLIEKNLKLNENDEDILKKYIWLSQYHDYKIREKENYLKINYESDEIANIKTLRKLKPALIIEDEGETRIIELDKMKPGDQIII